jgi:hypothetical protein
VRDGRDILFQCERRESKGGPYSGVGPSCARCLPGCVWPAQQGLELLMCLCLNVPVRARRGAINTRQLNYLEQYQKRGSGAVQCACAIM